MINNGVKILLIMAAAIFFGTALAHLSCIYFGPGCYRVQMAPAFAVEMAEKNWLLASSLNVLISSLFVVAGVYVLGLVGTLVKLPLLAVATLTISIVCLVRGIATLPLYYAHPESGLLKSFIVGSVWLAVGCITFMGYRSVHKNT